MINKMFQPGLKPFNELHVHMLVPLQAFDINSRQYD